MRKSPSRLFRDNKKALEEMLALRREGWSLRKLAAKYQVDAKCIYNYCDRAKVVSVILKFTQKGPEKTPKEELEDYYIDEFGDRVNRGKNYNEYLQEAKIKSTIML